MINVQSEGFRKSMFENASSNSGPERRKILHKMSNFIAEFDIV